MERPEQIVVVEDVLLVKVRFIVTLLVIFLHVKHYNNIYIKLNEGISSLNFFLQISYVQMKRSVILLLQWIGHLSAKPNVNANKSATVTCFMQGVTATHFHIAPVTVYHDGNFTVIILIFTSFHQFSSCYLPDLTLLVYILGEWI